jgi:hypothetical protein
LAAAQDALLLDQQLVSVRSQFEPPDFALPRQNHQILADLIAAVSIQLRVRVVAGRGRSHFSDPFRGAFQIIVFRDPNSTAMRGQHVQQHVRLRLVVGIQPYRRIVRGRRTWRGGLVGSYPKGQVQVRGMEGRTARFTQPNVTRKQVRPDARDGEEER